MRAELVHKSGGLRSEAEKLSNHGWEELGRQRRIEVEGISDEGNGVFTQIWTNVV